MLSAGVWSVLRVHCAADDQRKSRVQHPGVEVDRGSVRPVVQVSIVELAADWSSILSGVGFSARDLVGACLSQPLSCS